MALYSTETGLMLDVTLETFENYEERLMHFLVANKTESEMVANSVFVSGCSKNFCNAKRTD